VLTVEAQVAAWGFLVSDHLVVSGSCNAVQPMMGRGPETVPNSAHIVPAHRTRIRRLTSHSAAGRQGRRWPGC
jgi:hypothetical protein